MSMPNAQSYGVEVWSTTFVTAFACNEIIMQVGGDITIFML